MIDNFYKRKEVIVILPYNTLRVTDMIINMEFRTMAGLDPIPKGSSFTTEMAKLIYRYDKDFHSMYNISDSMYEKFVSTGIHKFYEIAPKTDLYSLATLLENKGSEIIVLCDNEKVKDDTFICKYYDGSIEELEKFLIKVNATALFTADLDVAKSIINRKIMDLKGFTFFISEMGYNLECIEDSIPILKDYENLRGPGTYEINTFKLYKYKRSK